MLLTSTRGAGHIGPLVPFAHACRRAGHEVLLAAPRSAWGHVARAKLPFAGLDEPSDEEMAPRWERVRATTDEDEQARVVIDEVFVGAFARTALPGILSLIRRWRPDVVVRETMEWAAAIAAEQLDVPSAQVACLMLAPRTDFGVPEALARLAADFGFERRDAPQPEPYLTLGPRALEDPAFEPMPLTRRFHVPAAPPQPLPDWWRGSDDPLVYVSFGSAAAGNGYFPDIYRDAAEALNAERVRVLMTLGTDVDPADLGPVPANVHVERWVPQAAVMPHAAAMVGHGGSGSTLAAMAAGMPLAVVPLFADQPWNAARIAALGAGLRLDGVDGLATAVRALLEEPSYRAAARAVAAEIAAQPPIHDVVSLLRGLARGEALAA